ncbi:hypothetical protein WG66_009955 [Moniliophthora roreri]|nr:hypothetical protein WG66_009955 [Moniliophthora roreri]
MKLLCLLPFLGLVSASPLNYDQEPLATAPQDGFSLDLNEQRLIQLENAEPMWMSERDKIALKATGVNFFDITDTQELGLSSYSRLRSELKVTFPSPNATEKVKPILKTLSTEGPKENLEKFTSFRTRYRKGKSKVAFVQDSRDNCEMGFRFTQESNFIQGIYSFVGSEQYCSSKEDEVVVISAHQDSTNMWPFLPAPDDGSGSVTILESYRALIAADYHPERTVEFHWYSAEEGGLLGSQAVAADYARRSVNVVAMSQFDMTAWVKRGTREEVGVITDYTDAGLTEFNKKLVELYLDIPYVETECGYACSDHASWRKAGYPSVFTIESSFQNSNKYIHSTNDRIDISDEFSFSHMLEFSKLAVGFAVELGGWAQ